MAGPAVYLDAGGESGYLPRRCQRVRFSIFLCFFLRMRLRRFLIRDPMASPTLADGDRTVSTTGDSTGPEAQWSPKEPVRARPRSSRPV